MEVANPTSTSQAPAPGLEGEASARREPETPPTEDADRLSATKSEVESALNHRRRWTVFRDACFSPEALNAFNAGDAPPCCSRWFNQIHGAVCKGHTGEEF